jgi:hypothetical protein
VNNCGSWSALNTPYAGTVTRRLRPVLTRHLSMVVRREKVVDHVLRAMTQN